MIRHIADLMRRLGKGLNVGRLTLTVLYALLLPLAIWYTQTHTGRAQRSIGFVVVILSAILLIRSVKRLLSEEIQAILDDLLEKIGAVIFFPAAWCLRKIAKFLGIGRWAGWGEDERTFLWKERDKGAHRKKRWKNDQKWADQTDNCHRVRYLYTEYMLKRIRSGYRFSRQMTPDEIAEDLALEEEEKMIFSTYDRARYDHHPDIDDNTVGLIMALTKRRPEIRKDRYD